MNSTADILNEAIKAREAELVAINAGRKRLKKRMLEVGIELRALKSVKDAVPAASNGRPAEVEDAPLDAPELLGPSEAVLQYVRNHPGFRPGHVVGALVGRIESESGDQEKLLFSVVRQLEKRGKLRRGEDGKSLYVVDPPTIFEDDGFGGLTIQEEVK